MIKTDVRRVSIVAESLSADDDRDQEVQAVLAFGARRHPWPTVNLEPGPGGKIGPCGSPHATMQGLVAAWLSATGLYWRDGFLHYALDPAGRFVLLWDKETWRAS